MGDVDHSASMRTICAVEQIPLHSSPVSAARFHIAGLATTAPLVDASLLRPVVRVDRDAFLAAIPRAPAWIALWELRAATGLTDAAIHRELRRQIGAGRVRASVVATCWQRQRRRAKGEGRGGVPVTARALRVACPFATCRAMPLFPCRNRDGDTMARPHPARVLAGDRAVLDRRLAALASISVSAARYRAIRAVAKARGVPMRAEVDAIITAGLDAVGAP